MNSVYVVLGNLIASRMALDLDDYREIVERRFEEGTSEGLDAAESTSIVELLELLIGTVCNLDPENDPSSPTAKGFHDVLGRLRQIESYLEPEIEANALAVFSIEDAPADQGPVASAATDTYEVALGKLHGMVGLEGVKREVETLTNLAKVFRMRQERGLRTPDLSFHLVFSGNPGTGKTTVARILGSLYRHFGLLSSGHLIEVDRSGLVASYVGQTAAKVSDVLKRAKGGVLFIDEAYSLAQGGEGDYGREAIETL